MIQEKSTVYAFDSINFASIVISSYRLTCVIHTSDWACGNSVWVGY